MSISQVQEGTSRTDRVVQAVADHTDHVALLLQLLDLLGLLRRQQLRVDRALVVYTMHTLPDPNSISTGM